MAAYATGIPNLKINDKDGEILAKAAKSLTVHYAYVPPIMKGPWLEIAGALGMVYGSKIGEFVMERNSAKPAPAAPSSPVTPNPPPSEEMIIPGTNIKVGDVSHGGFPNG